MPPDDSLTPRRLRLLDAGVEVTARHGLRGLTHRAVDREAGLPEGSCSAYLRTRRALQTAVAEYVAGRLVADVESLAAELDRAETVDRSIELTAGLFVRWLERPALLLTRLELAMETTRDAELAAVLAAARVRLTGLVAPVMSARGHAHPERRATVLVSSLDGVLLAALLKPADERRDFLDASLDLLIGALSAYDPA